MAEGTSIVAPLYAGLAAVINENLPPLILGPNISIPNLVGFLNPILYRFPGLCTDIDDSDKTINPGSPPDNGQGNLAGYPSGPGWDACTGLGTIDGTKLQDLLIQYALGTSASIFAQGYRSRQAQR